MKHHAVTESGALPRQDLEVASVLVLESFEIMLPERVGGEESVIAHVPPGRMPGITRMIQDGDADDIAVHGPEIIAPRRALTPGDRFPFGIFGGGGRCAVVAF